VHATAEVDDAPPLLEPCKRNSQLVHDAAPSGAQDLAMSRTTQIIAGLSLILVPTIIYGGLTLLGVVSGGAYGTPGPRDLTEVQQAFYRAGHAHAGVLLMLSLLLQLFADHARLGSLEWPVRVAAPLAALLVSGGFFGVAHVPALRAVLYLGAALVALATLAVGVGLLRGQR
jgi:hypothetical protein